MVTGVILGCVAAFFQSCSYIFSKRYVAKCEKGTIGLLIAAHCIMGIFAIVLFPFFMPHHIPAHGAPAQIALPVMSCVVFYLGGQAFLFLALKHADASRVSPLLGLKIIVLAAIGAAFTHQHFHVVQWLGILCAVAAAYSLGQIGNKLPRKSWLWIACACVSYSLSDISIASVIHEFSALGLFHASVFAACLCYSVCGVIAGLALVCKPAAVVVNWKAAFPFAVTWFMGILFLFGCFGSIGVVFGNIVQSLRGIMSIVGGSYVSRSGYAHIEARMPVRTVVLRSCAAMGMIAAIALFWMG